MRPFAMKDIVVILLLLVPATAGARKYGRVLVDSLQRELATVKADTSKVNILANLSYAYSEINADSGILLGNTALALAEKINWTKGKATAYADIAICYQSKGELNTALDYSNRSLKTYEQMAHKRGIAAVLMNTALIYQGLGNYVQALDYYHRALKVFEAMSDAPSEAITLENIGNLYLEQKDYQQTQKYFTAAISINRKLGDSIGLARNISNMGILHDAKGQHGRALESHLSALAINRQVGSHNSVHKNLVNIGIVYQHLGKEQTALDYQLEALKISEQLGSKSSIAISSGNVGELYLDLAKSNAGASAKSNLVNAIRHLEKAVAMCIEAGYIAPAAEFLPYLSEAYAMSGDYRKAYQYYIDFVRMRDSVFSLQTTEQMAVLENKRLTELHEKNMLLKDQEITITRLELKQKRQERILYIAGIGLLLLVVAWSIVRIRKYRISNRILADEKAEHRKIIRDQSYDIVKRKKILEEIAHKQSHDIRGYVATILGLADLFNKEDIADPVNRRVVEGINSSAQKLDAVIKEVVKKENDLNG